MENLNIQESNRLIAEFMEGIISGRIVTFKAIQKDEGDSGTSLRLLKYHTSWDWLMPVVEKIESLSFETDSHFIVKINLNSCFIHTIADATNYISKVHSPISKIDAVHKAVVEFIKWYNLNNKQND